MRTNFYLMCLRLGCDVNLVLDSCTVMGGLGCDQLLCMESSATHSMWPSLRQLCQE